MSTALATLGDFKDTFPEFLGVADALINRALADAAGRVAVGVYKEQTTRAHCLTAAHILTSESPWGQSARVKVKDTTTQETTYSLQLARLQSQRAAFIGCT